MHSIDNLHIYKFNQFFENFFRTINHLLTQSHLFMEVGWCHATIANHIRKMLLCLLSVRIRLE